MRPKFEVGEVVILQSVSLPERNGEYSVMEIYMPGRVDIDGSPYKLTRISYRLDGADEANPGNPHKGPTVFGESALRKKHIPGELNFRELMTSLISPKLITHSPQ